MLFILLPPLALAREWTIDRAGGGDFVTLTEGVASAVSGDTLLIAPGTYAEDLSLGGKSLTLIGSGSGSSVLTGTGTAIDARGSSSLSIKGVTIQGGVRGLDADGDVLLADVAFLDLGTGAESGAAIRLEGGSLEYSHGSIEGTLALDGALWTDNCEVDLQDVSFFDGDAATGGGLFATDSTVTVNGGEFARNSAEVDGGAIAFSGGSLSATGTIFGSNVADANGGCFSSVDSDVVFDGVSVDSCESGEPGGGISTTDGSLLIQDSSFQSDAAPGSTDILSVGTTVTINATSFSDPALDLGTEGQCEGGVLAVSIDSPDDAAVLTSVTLSGFGDVFACGMGLYVHAGSASVNGLTLGGCASSTDCASSVIVNARDVTMVGDAESDGAVVLVGDSVSVGPGAWSGDGWGRVVASGGAISDLVVSNTTLMLEGNADGVDVDGLTAADSTLQFEGTVRITGLLTTGGTVTVGAEEGAADVTLAGASLEDPYPGGIAVYNGSTLSMESVRVSGAPGGHNPRAEGGALDIVDGLVTIDRGWFGNNQADAGGAIAIQDGELAITASVFFHNEATAGVGATTGGALWAGGGAVSLDGVVFQENMANQGSAAYVAGGFPTIHQVTAVGNSSGDGGAFHLGNGYAAILNTISAYASDGTGFQADDATAASGSSLGFNDSWANGGGMYGGALTDVTGSDGNIAADPMFVAYTEDGDQHGDDLHLRAGSPCIDAGDPRWTDADGTVSDIGAYGGAHGADIDFDGDQQLTSEGDCDDSDASVYAGATEVDGDGIDQNCDGVDGGDTGAMADSGTPYDTASGSHGGGGSDAHDQPSPGDDAGCGCHGSSTGVGPLASAISLALLGARRRREPRYARPDRHPEP